MDTIANQISQTPTLVRWSDDDAHAYRHEPLRAKHGIHELDLFSDSALLDLLENYPRERLQAFTMGTDPTVRSDWQSVDTTGATGKDLLAAVTSGRLWFNILQVHLVDRRYRDLIEQLYGELSQRCDDFHPSRMSCTLIISSPGALVYFHADAQPNLLWQIRGSKRIWVYPSGDRDLIDQTLMEDIFANFADEEVPYRAEFDAKARVFELHPGQVLSWPQNAPHRVTNVEGVNISLSTVHETEPSDRRKLVYCANRLFRRSYHLPTWSTKEAGAMSYLKRFAFRVCRRAGLVHTPPRRVYLSKLRVDPRSPTGFIALPDGPVLTEFSKKDFRLEKDSSGKISVVNIGAAQGASAPSM
jgi:hypothetical protein